MSASEWNEKHPVGTRFLKPHMDNERGFTTSEMNYSGHVGYYVNVVFEFGLRTYELMNRFEVISAYEGDMYTGKPLKKLPYDSHGNLREKYNGDIRCDMATGPCACGAWH